jgi:transposase
MMGLKARVVTPRHTISLEELVPAGHFYRHLDRVLDLSFVRDLVRETYAPVGRPSLDPVVFFRLQLMLFFEGLRSERQLLRVVADRLSLRWYLGYDLGERLPDHSSLTRIRERYGLDVFRRFFEAIVERCQAAGLVWGKELYVDGTEVLAHAALASLRRPRFSVEAHLRQLFGEATTPPVEDVAAGPAAPGTPPSPPVLPTAAPKELAVATFELIAALEDAGIRAYVPLNDWDRRPGFSGPSRFMYEPERDAYRCPQGHLLRRHHVSNRIEAWIYRADTAGSASRCRVG